MSDATTQPEGELARLSWPALIIVIAAGTALFTLLGGPVWADPWNIGSVDRRIFWSYGAVPPLVVIALLVERKLSWRAALIDTLLVTIMKFVLTYALANVLWATTDRPSAGREGAPLAAAVPSVSTPAPPPSKIPASERGVIDGVVIDRAGRPVSRALVFVAKGLEGLAFAAPSGEPRVFENAGRGLRPALAAVQTYEPVRFRSSDGQLHTAEGFARDGTHAFNVPLLSAGRKVVFERARGEVTVRCQAHQARGEPAATMIILHHPFSTRTDAGGRFTLTGVPARAVAVVARTTSTRAVVRLVVPGARSISTELRTGDIAPHPRRPLSPPPKPAQRRKGRPSW